MKYGRHSVETYGEDFRHDNVVADAVSQVQKLNDSRWEPLPNESDLDRKHRIEFAYDHVVDTDRLDLIEASERQAVGEQWIDDRLASIAAERFLANDRQTDHDMKVGGQVARREEMERFRENALVGNEPELNAVIDDRTDRQAARREFLTNHVIYPAMEEKLKELALDKVVDEPKPIEEVEFLETKKDIEDSMQAYRARSEARGDKSGERDHLPD